MRREIKFRAWSSSSGKIIDSESLRNIGQLALSSGHQSTEFLVLPYPQERYSIMQYTGLKDKNGVEIYEGDIVKHGSSNKNCQIVYDQFDCSFVASEDDTIGYSIGFESYNMIEVLGNVYQNPELLDEDR